MFCLVMQSRIVSDGCIESDHHMKEEWFAISWLFWCFGL